MANNAKKEKKVNSRNIGMLHGNLKEMLKKRRKMGLPLPISDFLGLVSVLLCGIRLNKVAETCQLWLMLLALLCAPCTA